MNNDAWSNKPSASLNPVSNLMIRNAKVTSHVPHNNLIPELPPFSGLVEILVQVPVKAKCIMTNSAMQLQITESVFKGRILA